MFSLSSSLLYPQTVLPLSSYLQSQCSAIRFARHRKVSSVQKINSFERNCSSNGHKHDIDSFYNHNGMNWATIRKFVTPDEMREFALNGKLLITSTLYRQRRFPQDNFSDKRLNCHRSYVSHSSFDENKRGISLQAELTFSRLRSFLQQPSQLILNASLLTSTSNIGSVRWFRTERSEDRKVRRDLVTQEVDSGGEFQTKNYQAVSRQRLKALFGDEATEESQRSMKVAFAEGYLAGEGHKMEEPKSRIKKFIEKFAAFLLISSILVTIVFFVLMSQIGGNSGFSIHIAGKNEVSPEEINVSFEDVKGSEEAKNELEEIVDFLKNPQKYTSLGAELPRGVLLVGPPGTGKTLLARAVAGEAGVPFFHAAGSEFDEILVGQGAKRVRQLFATAKMRAPCVVFIDEIDSVGAKRSSSVLHPYANQTINQLLSEMDGFHKHDGVIVLGATNRRQDLDRALLRPGRFDVEVQVPIPDLRGRVEILNYYLDKIKQGKDIEVNVLGRGTTGFTGADLKNVVNQAALRAAADELDSVSMKHLEESRDKVLMGPERKNRIPDHEANLITAFHESGHTLVSHFTKDSTPLHKVTIIPRGGSLGHTAYIPEKEQYHLNKCQMLASLDSLMGGRVAEELTFGPHKVTMGASDDLKKATSIARSMVKSFGLSDKVGVRSFDEDADPFMGGESQSLSDQTKELIDSEIKKILQDSYERARTILKTHSTELKAMADALLRYETLDADDIRAILDGKPLEKGQSS